MKLSDAEIDELLGKMPIQYEFSGIPGSDDRFVKPLTYLAARNGPVCRDVVKHVEDLIDRKLNGPERHLPIDQKWLLQNGWMQIFCSDDDSFFFVKGIDDCRRLEIHALDDPITLTRVDDDYYWTGLCHFKNDGTRGPIMDLVRILDL